MIYNFVSFRFTIIKWYFKNILFTFYLSFVLKKNSSYFFYQWNFYFYLRNIIYNNVNF